MRHRCAHRLSNSLSCCASCHAGRTQPKQSSTSHREHTRSLSYHLQRLLRLAAPSETTLGNLCFGTEEVFASITRKKSPHQCHTQTTQTSGPMHCSLHSSGQIRDESLSGAAPAFFTAQVSARDRGGHTGFLAFLLVFPAEITACQGQHFHCYPTCKHNSLQRKKKEENPMGGGIFFLRHELGLSGNTG